MKGPHRRHSYFESSFYLLSKEILEPKTHCEETSTSTVAQVIDLYQTRSYEGTRSLTMVCNQSPGKHSFRSRPVWIVPHSNNQCLTRSIEETRPLTRVFSRQDPCQVRLVYYDGIYSLRGGTVPELLPAQVFSLDEVPRLFVRRDFRVCSREDSH